MRSRHSKKTFHGFAFPDYIGLEQESRHKHYSEGGQEDDPKTNNFLLPLFLVALTAILVLKLFSLQIFQGSYYKNLSDKNRTKTILVRAPRGIIFDRKNKPLVFNIPGFRETINGKTNLITREQAMELIASGKKDLEVDTLRQYPFKEKMVHILGYIGQISEDDLKQPNYNEYNSGDLIGKAGVEQQYESMLKGVDGKQLVEVNSMGKSVRTLGQVDPISGQDIHLTIDSTLQQAAFDAALGIKKGAVIVSTPQGEILAMVSKPSFDPNLFTLGKTYKPDESDYKDASQVLLDSEGQPLLNRVIAGVYPPGSTFKIITAAAGLQGKIIDESFEIIDNGILKIGDFSFANWYFTQYGKTEGAVNVIKALMRSNDIFFYKLAEMVGIDKLSEVARRFGLGEKTGISLVGELKGLVPDTKWKKEEIGEQWYLGDTYHYGIGQGFLLTTPLQVNVFTQVIANGGVLYQPTIEKNQKLKIKGQNIISKENIDIIKEGMIKSCSEGGVAWPLFNFKVQNENLRVDGKNFLEASASDSASMTQVAIACKTGTAQHGGETTLPHAWITLFAPAYNPEIVITVLSESSGEGSNVAAPVAKKILESWFSR